VTTSSPRASRSVETARFALWPLPDLRLPRAASPTSGDGQATPEENEYARGVQAGRVAGRSEVVGDVDRVVQAVGDVHRELCGIRDRLHADNEATVYELAVAIARLVIQQEVKADASIIQRLVVRALEEVTADGDIEVRLNPADLDALQRLAPIEEPREPNPIRWTGDPTLERGSCIVETPRRIVDGRLETTLRDLHHRLCDE
jgi:flagellar biosynthesis/type III secretory pathway protein FliH